ncbi:MAG: biopolymer transporter ExbD [Elusimicrobia bacterium]|nr:biopolymer transporter ExbD [Elusimicrobiota bacterium]MBP9127967.1 biopolymer transporter ExbD [Elusimicrobiota bacterium]MBP9698720.1 biopolymer transporter ExbD [Elusimicrobiota bacterium]
MNDVRRRITGDGAISGVNIVPVIDLCLVLLVILLILSPMMDDAPVEVTLPKAHISKEEQENNITLTVDPAGNMAVNTTPVDLAGLGSEIRRQLRTRDPNVVVVIRADERVQYGGLTDLMKIAKEAGAQYVALGTRDIDEESKK